MGAGRRTAPAPRPPPVTTIARRLSHLGDTLPLCADRTVGSRTPTRDDYVIRGDVATAVAAFDAGATAWRQALLTADDAALDTVGHRSRPHGSGAEEPFIDSV